MDLVRPGGVVAVVTSSGTMDKQNTSVREYLANRADLLGAIRLPSNAFQRNANTEVVADILFLQKRDRAALTIPYMKNHSLVQQAVKEMEQRGVKLWYPIKEAQAEKETEQRQE